MANHPNELVKVKSSPAWFGLIVPLLVQANPQGGQVAAGSASIQDTTTSRIDVVQETERAIINWREFSIEAGEHTNFRQPSSSSATLNRVTGTQRSDIEGGLTANGHVFMVNPNGILFGQGARVNVGGLIATTADIDDENFIAGRYVFDKPSGNADASVTNLGQIEVDDNGTIVLAASHVANEGVIDARLGQVEIAGANTFTVDFDGDGLLQFDIGSDIIRQPIDENGAPVDALVSNTGTISADGGSVIMDARSEDGVIDHVMNIEGLVRARNVDGKQGAVAIRGGEHGTVEVSGTLDVSGPNDGDLGGEVRVLGEQVGLFDSARINAAGAAGGGEVIVGGNLQGMGPEPNAKRTYISRDASVDASAIDKGDGGRVIVWADEVTRDYGSIGARGGRNGGDGGFIEVSGKAFLDFQGNVSVDAPQGRQGSVLFDPLSIDIQDTAPDGPSELQEDDILAFGELDGLTTVLSDETLTDIEGNIVLQAQQDISINTNIALDKQTAGESVVFQAGRDIDINANVETDGANLHFEADSPHSSAGAADDIGQLAVGDSLRISSKNGNISMIFGARTIGNSSIIDSGTGNILIGESEGGEFVIGNPNNPIDLAMRTKGTLSYGTATTAGADGLGAGAVTPVITQLRFLVPKQFSVSNLELVAENDVELGAPLSNTGSLEIHPLDPTTSISIGSDASQFNLSATDLANLSSFESITIGRENGSHPISISNAVFTDPVTIQSPSGGSITVNSSGSSPGLTGVDDASINLIGSGSTTSLNADIVTQGQPITINDNVFLGSDVLLDTTGGGIFAGADILFGGPVNGASRLRLQAGNNTGDITFSGDIGTVTKLAGLDILTADDVFISSALAGPTTVNYTGTFTTSPTSLDVDALTISSAAAGATLFGIVSGVSGFDASVEVEGPMGDPDFTINTCVIGIPCNLEPEAEPTNGEPPVVHPDIITRGGPDSGSGSLFDDDVIDLTGTDSNGSGNGPTREPSLWRPKMRLPATDEVVSSQLSDLGNEELWNEEDEAADGNGCRVDKTNGSLDCE